MASTWRRPSQKAGDSDRRGLFTFHQEPKHYTSSLQYDKALYRRRNEVERLFRRLKGFRRIFSRFDKLDLVFIAFIYFALIVEGLR
jgi:transposase